MKSKEQKRKEAGERLAERLALLAKFPHPNARLPRLRELAKGQIFEFDK